MNGAFAKLLGTGLTAKELPEFPYGIDSGHPEWPVDPATKKTHIRFMWGHRKKELQKTNADALAQVFEYVTVVTRLMARLTSIAGQPRVRHWLSVAAVAAGLARACRSARRSLEVSTCR